MIHSWLASLLGKSVQFDLSQSTSDMQRVSLEQYKQLPEGHRTTFVTGMQEMLAVSALLAKNPRRRQINRILDVAAKYTSGELSAYFDRYLTEDLNKINYQAASVYYIALCKLVERDKAK